MQLKLPTPLRTIYLKHFITEAYRNIDVLLGYNYTVDGEITSLKNTI